MTRLLLVRHGETEWNREERFRGRADIPLNAKGLAQAEATARCIASRYEPSAVYASPLSRAVQTAEAIASRYPLPVQVHAGLADIDYGQWQGLSPDEVRARWPRLLAEWYQTPQLSRIPGGESLGDLAARGLQAIREISHAHKDRTVVAVGHTVINRVILLCMLGLGNDRFWRIRQDTCAINEIEMAGEEFTLVSLNDTCHLRSGLGM